MELSCISNKSFKAASQNQHQVGNCIKRIANVGIEMAIKPAIAAIAIAILNLGIFCFSTVVDVFMFLSINC
jgi:hypothetical protein